MSVFHVDPDGTPSTPPPRLRDRVFGHIMALVVRYMAYRSRNDPPTSLEMQPDSFLGYVKQMEPSAELRVYFVRTPERTEYRISHSLGKKVTLFTVFRDGVDASEPDLYRLLLENVHDYDDDRGFGVIHNPAALLNE